MRRLPAACLLSVAVAVTVAAFAYPERARSAAPPATLAAIEEAFRSVRESLSDLIAAKDERRIDELRFRVNTYRDILRFTRTDIQDLHVRLSTSSPSTGTTPADVEIWKRGVLSQLSDAAAALERDQTTLDATEGVLSLSGVSELAKRFQTWREEWYLPRTESARDYLLLERQAIIIETATRRLQKISGDVRKIQRIRIRGSARMVVQLHEAERLIQSATALYEAARVRFRETTFPPLVAGSLASSTSTPTSTVSGTVIILPLPPVPREGEVTTTASTTAGETPQLPVVSPSTPLGIHSVELQTPKPKELIRSSLEKIRSAYELFMAMGIAAQKLTGR